jgi:cytochrome b6-f complex iron-sulfur subunit
MTLLAATVSVWQWVIIGVAIAVALAGFGLVAVNVLSMIRPRTAGEEGPPRKLVGPPAQVTRRGFLRRVMGTGFGLAFTEAFALGTITMLWPNLGAGFGSKITLSATADEIKQQIRATKQPFYYAPGRFYLVAYDESNAKAKIYKDANLLGGGLMALYQRCVHLGCRVPYCQTSQWFECPCHGSKYNGVGEYKQGPAPRGLDRFPITVENGIVTVNTGVVVVGPPRGTDTTGQQPEGAFCVIPGGEKH